jgi:hypothetical protein
MNVHVKKVEGTEETRLASVRVIHSVNLVFSLIWIRLIVRAAACYSEHAGKEGVGLRGLVARLVTLSTRDVLKEVDDPTNNGMSYLYGDIQNIIGWVGHRISYLEEQQHKGEEITIQELVEYKLISITLREMLLPEPTSERQYD